MSIGKFTNMLPEHPQDHCKWTTVIEVIWNWVSWLSSCLRWRF